MPLARDLYDLLDAGLASLLDPVPFSFRPGDERGVRPVRKACAGDNQAPVKIRQALNRNAFLRGCLDFTGRAPLKHLIVGLGTRHGSTTRVDAVAHVVGTPGSVAIPAWVSAAVAERAQRTRGEALIVRNHPPPSLNSPIDVAPVASGADRDALIGAWRDPQFWLRLFAGRRVHAYVVASGYVREFRPPRLLGLLESLARRDAQC